MEIQVGTVKEVVSGDTVVLVGPPRGGPPPEKRLSFSSIVAPRVAMKSTNHEVEDEPYGWAAREFLRKQLIGKQVEFKVEYTLPSNNRENGFVRFPGIEETLSHALVREGYAQLRGGKNPPCSSSYEELEALQEKAKAEQKNVWCEDSDVSRATIRDISWAVNDVDLVKAFVEKNLHQTLQGTVEYVRDGGCLRVLFTDDMTYCSVLVSGVQCDGFRRAETTSGGSDASLVAEPFAAEARFFVEIRFLNRDVNVRIEGSDDFGNVFGSVFHPKGGCLASLLLKNGFARVQDYSARLTSSPAALREALKEAQKTKLRRWKNWEPQSMDGLKEYTARVVEVLSGDCLYVTLDDDVERRLYLASIRCPRLGGKNKEDELWAFEAKEFARKKVIGKAVKVTLEYMRDPIPSTTGAPPPPGSDEQGRMHFVSITWDASKNSLSELLLANGLAKTLTHRADDPAAENYDKLTEVEKAAAEQQKGLHGPETSAKKHRINDLLGPSNAQRARTFEKQLTAYPKIEGVIEHIFNAGRFKLRLPALSLAISFTLGGIRCPQTARPTGPGMRDKEAEPFAAESMRVARDRLMQRDVVIKVEGCDRGGNFLGTLLINKKNWSAELLEMGMATTVDFSLQQMPPAERSALVQAEQSAKAQRKGIWTLPEYQDHGEEEVVEKTVDETLPAVSITHINSLLDFYVQEQHASSLQAVMKALRELNLGDEEGQKEGALGAQQTTLPIKGEIVLGRFTADDQWYRARVDSRNSGTLRAGVTYIDFGNTESLPLSRIRRCPPSISVRDHPPLARPCCLSGLMNPPDLEEEAAQLLHELTEGRIFTCKVEKIDKMRRRHVVLTEEEENQTTHSGNSLNEKLLRQGLARLDKNSTTKLFTRLKKEEEAAKKAHLNVWRYGDVGDDDDGNDDEKPSLSNGRSRGRR